MPTTIKIQTHHNAMAHKNLGRKFTAVINRRISQNITKPRSIIRNISRETRLAPQLIIFSITGVKCTKMKQNSIDVELEQDRICYTTKDCKHLCQITIQWFSLTSPGCKSQNSSSHSTSHHTLGTVASID
jgi:hypothetical protein